MKNSRGSVLITVIWMLSLLTVFTLALNRRVSQELFFGRWMKETILTRFLAKAGVERALYEIQDDEFLTFDTFNERWGFNEEAFKDIPVGDGSFSVICGGRGADEQEGIEEAVPYGACDESARINVNTVSEEILKNLVGIFLELGDEKRATQVAQSIIDWRDQDEAMRPEGAEKRYYQAVGADFIPRNGPLESIEELQMIRGIDPDLFRQIKPFVTVYTEGKVNFNTASETVFKALGLNTKLAQKIIDLRNGEDGLAGTEDDGIFQAVESITPTLSVAVSFSPEEFSQISNLISQGFVSVQSDAFRIHSIGRFLKNSRSVENVITCVVKRDGTVLYWREGSLA